MKKAILWITALFAIVTLAGCNCNKEQNPSVENVGIANPASVYCGENGGTLQIETSEDWGQYWICMFEDGSYCEEWSYFRGECQAGEIIYNTVTEQNNSVTSELYSEEDLAAAEDVIINRVNEWEVIIESFEARYAWDEMSIANLDYCKELANAKWENIDECIVFTSSFHIPEQDTPMAGSFEPNANIAWYGWYLGRATAGEWEILTNGFG